MNSCLLLLYLGYSGLFSCTIGVIWFVLRRIFLAGLSTDYYALPGLWCRYQSIKHASWSFELWWLFSESPTLSFVKACPTPSLLDSNRICRQYIKDAYPVLKKKKKISSSSSSPWHLQISSTTLHIFSCGILNTSRQNGSVVRFTSSGETQDLGLPRYLCPPQSHQISLAK